MDIQELKKVSSTLALSGQFMMIPAHDVLKLIAVVEAAKEAFHDRRCPWWHEHTLDSCICFVRQIEIALKALGDEKPLNRQLEDSV